MAANAVVTDANLWISRYLPTDSFHRQSRAWLDAWLLDDNSVFAPNLILSEVGGAIARQTHKPARGLSAISELRNIPLFNPVDLDETIGHNAARLAATLRLRGADATYVALAAHLSVPLVTWDRELLQRTDRIISAYSPATG